MAAADKTGSAEFTEIRMLNTPWRAVLHLARRQEFPRGYEFFLGRELYFLSRGRVRLTQQNPDGQEKVLWYIGRDCLFGETPFFALQPPMAFFFCVEKSVVHSFDEATLRAIWRDRPELMLNLTQSMASKMRTLVHHAASMCLDNALVRLCKFLEQRIIPDSEPLTADLGLSRQEIAGLLGINRISLYKLLRQQEELGVLGPVQDRRVVIRQPDIFFQIIAGAGK